MTTVASPSNSSSSNGSHHQYCCGFWFFRSHHHLPHLRRRHHQGGFPTTKRRSSIHNRRSAVFILVVFVLIGGIGGSYLLWWWRSSSQWHMIMVAESELRSSSSASSSTAEASAASSSDAEKADNQAKTQKKEKAKDSSSVSATMASIESKERSSSKVESVLETSSSMVESTIKTNDNISTKNGKKKRKRAFKSFGFYLMGDTPYAPWEDDLLQEQLHNLTTTTTRDDNMMFIIHVGDMQKVQRTNCSLEHSLHIRNLLYGGEDDDSNNEAGSGRRRLTTKTTNNNKHHRRQLPTMIIPGDNDWYDCANPTQALEQFRSVFFPVPSHMWTTDEASPWDLWMVHPTYPELMAWKYQGVVFITVHLIHGLFQRKNEELWQPLLKLSGDWVHTVIVHALQEQQGTDDDVRGVILLGHSLRSPRTRPFFEQVWNQTFAPLLQVPTLYLHGDGHKWDLDTKFSHQMGWKYYHDIQCDQGGLAHPLKIHIAGTDWKNRVIPLEADGTTQQQQQQYLFAKGLYRIDRQGGLYSNTDLATSAT